MKWNNRNGSQRRCKKSWSWKEGWWWSWRKNTKEKTLSWRSTTLRRRTEERGDLDERLRKYNHVCNRTLHDRTFSRREGKTKSETSCIISSLKFCPSFFPWECNSSWNHAVSFHLFYSNQNISFSSWIFSIVLFRLLSEKRTPTNLSSS